MGGMNGDFTRLPRTLRQALAGELAAGERLLYAARPDWRAEWGKLLTIFIFGVFWSAIAFIFLGSSVAGLLGFADIKSDGQPAGTGLLVFVFLFSCPFAAIGCLVLAAPFLGIRKSRNTVHAVTDARLLSVYTGSDRGADSIPLAKVNFIHRRDKKNTSGSLSIGYGVEKDSDGEPRPLVQDWSGIADARRAEAVIRQQAHWVR